MNYTGILCKAELFMIENMTFAYGIVVEHQSSRWQKGDWLCTSLIETINKDSMTIRTMNSLYKVDCLSEAIELSYEQWGLVRQGMSPTLIKTLEADQSESH